MELEASKIQAAACQLANVRFDRGPLAAAIPTPVRTVQCVRRPIRLVLSYALKPFVVALGPSRNCAPRSLNLGRAETVADEEVSRSHAAVVAGTAATGGALCAVEVSHSEPQVHNGDWFTDIGADCYSSGWRRHAS